MDFSLPKTRHIKLVGIELEGGWKQSRGITPYGDGSVHSVTLPPCGCGNNSCTDCVREPTDLDYRRYMGDCGRVTCRSIPITDPARCQWCREIYPSARIDLMARNNRPSLLIGETCSDPLPPIEALHWLIATYPDASNESCGLHVHISFGSVLRYAQLMDKEFWVFYRKDFEKWAKANLRNETAFWNRWEGNNQYCRPNFVPDVQSHATNKSGERYAVFNYAFHCQVGHVGPRRSATAPRKTIEYRVLPIFKDKTVAAAAICEHLRLIEEYLNQRARVRARESQKATVMIDFDPDNEERAEPIVRYA